MTKGEQLVADLLTASHYNFIPEKTFSDLKHGLLRFDFYIPSLNSCIEWQGELHYEFNPHFFKSPAEFRRAQGRDMAKIHYCLAHSIPLYVIPYWEFSSLHTAEDLFSSKYLATSKYKNIDDYTKFTSGRAH